MIKMTRISTYKADELLQQGGLNWILFEGDDFDAGLFAEWSGYSPTGEEAASIDAKAAALTHDEALQIEVSDA